MGDLIVRSLISTQHHLSSILFYALLVAVGLLGLAMIYCPDVFTHYLPSIRDAVFEELGKALLIASILALSVDLYVKQRLLTDFVRDVSPYIEGIGLPRGFQEEIRHIRTIELHRLHYILTYTLQWTPDPKYLSVEVFVTYDVVNDSGRSQIFPHRFSADVEYPFIAQPQILLAGSKGGTPEYELFKDGTEKNDIAPCLTSDAGSLAFYKAVSIPPTHSENDRCKFWGRKSSVSAEHGFDVMYLTMPTLDPEVRVDYPDDLEVTVYFGHRYQDSMRHAIVKDHPTRPRRWQLQAGCLTWQAITVSWNRVSRPPVQGVLPGMQNLVQPKSSASADAHDGLPKDPTPSLQTEASKPSAQESPAH